MLTSMWKKPAKIGSQTATKRPTLETLEDRCVPAAVPMTILSDRTGGLYAVDVATGKTTFKGKVDVDLRDIAMSPAGKMYGLGQDNKLYRINGFGGANPKAELVGTMANPWTEAAFAGLEFRKDGKLFASGSGTVYEVNPNTAASTLAFKHGAYSSRDGDLAFDPAGNTYVTAGNGVARRTPSGEASVTSLATGGLTGLTWRDGALVAFSEYSTSYYRLTYGEMPREMGKLDTNERITGATQFSGTVVPPGPPVPPVPPGPSKPVTTYYVDRNGGLFSVNVATGKATSLGKVGVVMDDVAMSPSGVLYGVSAGKLYKISLGAAPKATLVAALRTTHGHALTIVTGLEFRKDGRLFAAATNTMTSVYEVNVTSGVSTLKITLPKQRGLGNERAGDLVFDPNGNLYVSVQNGHVWKWGTDGSLSSYWTKVKFLNGLVWRDGALHAFADDTGFTYRIAFGTSITKVSTLSTKTGVYGATQTF